MANLTGTIDYRDDRFVARFAYDAALVAELKGLKLGAREKSSDEWTIERHRPSIARLVGLARERDFRFTAAATRALDELKEQEEAAEFSVDVVQGGGGEPWFKCSLGGDYDLVQRVLRIADSYEDDDSYWVPAYREASCDELWAIVEGDERLAISDAAYRLLLEPDTTFELPRDATLPEAPDTSEDADALLGGTWEATELDYEMHTLSYAVEERDFKVAGSLRRPLLPHQVAGVRYLCSASRAFVADELGLDKTVQALATIETLASYPALILCPAVLARKWLREAERTLPALRSIAVVKAGAGAVPRVDVLIVSYELLARDPLALGDRSFDAIVADESHCLRNREAQRTQAAIDVASRVDNVRLCLSSLPSAPNRPIELAPQLAFLGLLESEFGGFFSFASRYCAPKDDGASTRYGVARSDELAQRLRSVGYLARKRSNVLPQLAAEPHAREVLELREFRTYAAVEEEARAALSALSLEESEDDARSEGYRERSEARRVQRLACIERVLEECGRQKTTSVARWVQNFLASREPLVVLARHRDVVEALRESFPRALTLTADDSASERAEVVRAFQAASAELVVCSLQAAEARALFSRGRHFAFAEIGFRAEPEAQNEARVHRIGREQSVCNWYLVGDGTLDVLALDVLDQRRLIAGELHDRDLLEIADALARLTEPRPSLRALDGGAQTRALG